MPDHQDSSTALTPQAVDNIGWSAAGNSVAQIAPSNWSASAAPSAAFVDALTNASGTMSLSQVNRPHERTYDEVLASLPMIERWKYAAHNNRLDFVINVVALLVSVGALVSSIFELVISRLYAAPGEAGHGAPIVQGRGYDPMDWFIMFIGGSLLLWSLWNANKAGTGENVKLGRENIRIFLGAAMPRKRGGPL